jgi:EmrB/QacA subfamily drug resistance transporter
MTETSTNKRVPDWVVLAIACVAQFMVVLDVSIVNVALPSMARELHYTQSGLTWVVNAYVLTFAGFLLLGGRAADLFGRRRVYVVGLAVFTVASLLGGLAQTSTQLTAARAVQGLGGAIVSPATLTIIVTTFSGARLTRALGVWSAVAGAGGAAGSLLGGVLTAELSWRWVLFVNIPIGVGAMVAALLYLTESRRDTAARTRLDIVGAITVTGGLGALIYAIVGTTAHGWLSAQTLAWFGVAVVLLAVFAVDEARFASSPLVPFRLFRNRSVSGANMVMLLVGAAFFSFWYFLTLYMQYVLHFSALRTGFAFFPMAVAIIIGAQVSARAVVRIGVRPMLQIGTLIAVVGFAWLSTIGPDSSYWAHVFGPACLVALALGLLFTPLASAATAGVHYTEAGLASGVLNTARQMGGSLGLAILTTIATAATTAQLKGHVPLPAAQTHGYSQAFLVACGISVVAFVATFVVPTRRAPALEADPVQAATAGEEGALPTFDPA